MQEAWLRLQRTHAEQSTQTRKTSQPQPGYSANAGSRSPKAALAGRALIARTAWSARWVLFAAGSARHEGKRRLD